MFQLSFRLFFFYVSYIRGPQTPKTKYVKDGVCVICRREKHGHCIMKPVSDDIFCSV